MKNTLLIVSDAEGVTSIAGWKDVADDFNSLKPTKKLIRAMSTDISAALQGAYDAGIRKAIVLDWHYLGKNIKKTNLVIPKGMDVVLRSESPELLKQISHKVKFAALMGLHGTLGTNDCAPPWFEDEFLSEKKCGVAHTFTFTINKIYLDGIKRGEGFIYAKALLDLDVPLIFASGSKAAVSDIKLFNKKIYAVATRDGIRCFDAAKVRADIRKKIADAIRNADKIKLLDKTKFESCVVEFVKSKDPRYLEDIAKETKAFLDTIPEKCCAYNHGRLRIYPKTNKPYFEIYSWIINSFKESAE